MPTGEHITGDQNVRDSMDMLPTWKLQKMSTQYIGSLLLLVSRSWSSFELTKIWKCIMFQRQDNQLYKFREGDFKRLRRQDIKDMLLLLLKATRKRKNSLQGQTLIPFRSQKNDSLHAYHNIQGIIYQDDMDINRLMRTDELHKFSDGTLNHVRTALNDIATGIQMEYLPKRKWSKQDKQRALVMINAIDKKLRDRRLMRSLEKFVGGRPYGGDLRLLQRTI
ncbi:hypothetical protein Tco_0784738 [Tanacetum coccineum]